MIMTTNSKLRRLGSSDLHIFPIIFGAWAIGGWYWGGSDDDLAVRAIHQALDMGINMIDTAPMYGYGHSEEIVGRALQGRREQALIATKCGLCWDTAEGVFFFDAEKDGSRKVYRNLKKTAIMAECEGSLRRLKTDVIDLYQCHWPDTSTPLEETLEALLQLKAQGKIRAIGVCNFTVEMLLQAQKLAPIASEQAKYNLLERKIEKGILTYCRKHKLGVLAYSPLAQGLLTGTMTPERILANDDWRADKTAFSTVNRARILTALEKLRPIANHHHTDFAQIAINWLLHEPGVTAAIAGIRTPVQAIENAAAATFMLNTEERQTIREVLDVPLIG